MLLKTNHIPTLIASIKKNSNKNQVAIISITEDLAIDIPLLIKTLNENNIIFVGGIFPKLIHNNLLIEQGITVVFLPYTKPPFIIKDISKKEFLIPKIQITNKQDCTLFTYVDGLTSNITNYLFQLYKTYGSTINYFGGGAGSLTLQQKPCVFSKEGFFEDAAVCCFIDSKGLIGVNHGWKKIEGPLIATKTEGTKIEEINWKNAFEVYKEIVEKNCRKKFTGKNFFDIAKSYPFGMLRENEEDIVRDPISVTEDGALVCVGEVPENTLLNILKGEKNILIDAAKDAAKKSLTNSVNPNNAIIIDCISRVLFLENSFATELTEIQKAIHAKHPKTQISGALTLGEISSYGEGYLEFFNKTIVVGLFE